MVEKLIILNLPHPAKFAQGLRTLSQLRRSAYIFWFQLPWFPEWRLGKDNCTAIAKIFASTAVNKNAFTESDLNAYKAAASQPGALTAMLNYYRNILPRIFHHQHWQILAVSTLMIWGEQDVALGKEMTYGTETYVSDLQIKYIANSGHWVQQEQPEIVTQYMKEFLSIA
jgi:pimeloyl-ACP methyl ester carboxylesterase